MKNAAIDAAAHRAGLTIRATFTDAGISAGASIMARLVALETTFTY